MPAVREATSADLLDWDRLTVGRPNGHVYQSRTWAEQRARLGWRPRFLVLEDDQAALALLRPYAVVPGSTAYIPRGPVWDPGDDAQRIAERLRAITEWLADDGVDVVASDAEIPAYLPGIGAALAAIGFAPIPEIQPSRHRVSLRLAPDTDDAAVRAGLTKSTRQRITAAEADGIAIHRHDTAGWPGDHPIFLPPDRPTDAAFEEFATLLEGTGERRGFRFGPRAVFIDWWRAGHAAGLVVHLEARRDGETLGALLCYRHGDRLSTVHSADAPGVRERHPGVMHLLRWRAIQLAIREGRDEMDLGGVDVAPDHREPAQGDPMAGLYEHKRSFGATWSPMVGAHERMIRPWRYPIGRTTTRLARAIGR
jgi:lipid II:glycine glycyltransferase (peptidoglycan interpeptide bridge formation enzyme)